MKRALLALALSASLLLSPALAAETATFSDVSAGAWYAPYVEACAQDGLMNGTGNNAFTPDGIMTEAETAALAARIHSLRHGGDGTFEPAPAEWGQLTIRLPDGSARTDYVGPGGFTPTLQAKGGPELAITLTDDERTWAAEMNGQAASVDLPNGQSHEGTLRYDAQAGTLSFLTGFGATSNAYIAAAEAAMSIPTPQEWSRSAAWYLEENGLRNTQGFRFSEQPATRLDFALAIAASAGELEEINQVSTAPDMTDPFYWDRIAPLYAAGILTGVDSYGTFNPEGTLTRAECAAMAARIIRPELRLTNTQEALPAALAELGRPVRPLLAEDEVLAITQEPTLIYTTDGRVLDWEGQLQCELGSCYDSWEIFRSDKLARVCRDGLYGFINLAGEEIVPCQYEAATTYHDWVVLAGSQEEGFTAFDKSGEVLGTLDGSVNYDDTSEKLIQYMDESTGLYGYLNPDGSVAVEAAYTSVYPFSGGYAAVRDESGLYGFINTEGELVIPCQFAYVADSFSSYKGYAVVGTAGTTSDPAQYDGKLGLINTAGELVIPMAYDYLQNSPEYIFPFARTGEDGTVVKGYLSPDGTEHVPELLTSLPENQFPAPFANSYAPFQDGDLQGIMDTQFEVVLPAAFDKCVSGASGGLILVLLDGMWYQVDP